MPEFVIFLKRRDGAARPTREAVEKHCQRLNALSLEGRYIAGGPFIDETGGGMIAAQFDSAEEAAKFAQTEPFVQIGYSDAEVRSWEWSRPDNGQLEVLPPRPSSFPNFLTSINLRHTAREFSQRPISKPMLEKILDAALNAPSEFNLQPWRPVVCHSQADRERLMRACFNQSQVGAAAVAIICAVDPRLFIDEAPRAVDDTIAAGRYSPSEREDKIALVRSHYRSPRDSAIRNGTIFGHQLLLTGFSQGLAGFWLGGFDDGVVHDAFNIPERVVIVGIVGLGWPKDIARPLPRRSLPEVIHWGSWREKSTNQY